MKPILSMIVAVSTLAAEAITFNLPTSHGPIEIQVLNSSSTKRPYSSYYDLKMHGTVVNRTTVTLGETRLTPVYRLNTGAIQKGRSLGQITIYGLEPGASKEFEIWEPTSEFGFNDVESLVWETNLAATIRYSFHQPFAVKQLGAVKATAKVDISFFAIEIENNSDAPVEIIWDDSSFIDLSRKASRVFHVGVKYSEREKSQPNTVIPPLAKIEDEVTPSANAYYREGGRYAVGGWSVEPLLPAELPLDKLNLMPAVPGGKLGLFLQLLISGKKVPLSFVFEIESASSGKQRWPAPLQTSAH